MAMSYRKYILRKFNFDLMRFKNITNTTHETIITGTSLADSIRNYGGKVTISTGNGDDTVYNDEGSNCKINTGEGNDSVYNNWVSKCTINTGEGNDSVYNSWNDDCTINTGAGNDYVYGKFSSSKILGGAGNDSIKVDHTYLGGSINLPVIDGGEGNDSILSNGYGIFGSVNGGAGNDFIDVGNKFGNTTIEGGSGDDTIYGYRRSGYGIVYKYNSGDGNDKIYNFGDEDTLSISGGSYDTFTLGNSIGVSVGNSYIILDGAASLASVNIAGTEAAVWTLDGTTAKYGTSSKTLLKVSGVKSLSGLKISNKTVTVSAASLNQKTVTISDGYTLKLGSDVITPATKAAGWTKSGSNATYKAASTTAGYTLANNQINYVKASGGASLATVKGVKSTSGLSVSNNVVTLNKSALNNKVTLGGSYEFNFATGDYKKTSIMGSASADVITSRGKNLSINGGKGNDTIKISGTGTTVTGGKGKDVFIYNSGSGRITDFKAEDTLRIGNGTGTYSSETSGKNLIVTVGDNEITLVGAASLSSPNIIGTKAVTETNSWTLDGTTATYGTASKTLVTVKGLKSGLKASNGKISGLSLSGKTVTVSKAALGTSKVTISDGYTLALGSDVIESKSVEEDWTKSGSTAIYKTASTTKGYKLANNQITYKAASGGKGLATIKGASSTTGLNLSGKVVTLKKGSLNSKVTLGGNYDFNLASGDYKKTSIMGSASADVITSNGKNLSINGGKGNDTIKISGAGTTVTGGAGKDVFIYSGGSGRITDFKAEDTLRIGNGNGTYSSETSGKNLIVTVGDNEITLVGAANLSSPNIAGTKKTYDEGVIKNGKRVKLTNDYSSETFTLANDNSVLTVDASEVVLDVKITGNRFMNSILGGNGKDTLNGGGSNDTLTGGDGSDIFVYTLGDGDDTITDYAEQDKISIVSAELGGSSFSTNGDDVIITVGSGENQGMITVQKAKDKIIKYIDKNKKELGYYNAVIIAGKTATLTEEYTAQTFVAKDKFKSVQTIDANAIKHDIKITGSNGGDFIIGGKGKNTLIGGKGSDTLQGGKSADVFIYNKGDGDDIITNYGNGDIISVNSAAVSDAIEYDGDDVIFSVNNNGTITVKGRKGKRIKIIDKNGETNNYYGKGMQTEPLWFAEDDTNFDNADNQLGSIIKSSASAYSFADDNVFSSASNLPAVSYSTKK